MKAIIRVSVLLVLLWLGASVRAQEEPIPLPADRQSPELAMVILLDDTRTMINQNSASVSTKSPYSAGTDPDDIRASAVREIAALLHANPNQVSQLAVYSFRSSSGQWLTNSAGDKFITLGGAENVEESQRNLDALSSALRARTIETLRGGGQTTLAVNAAYEALNTKFGSGVSAPAQMVTAVITDDVPIEDFARSPWTPGTESDWLANDAADFKAAVDQLTAMSQAYTGSTCVHSEGRSAFALFPMGAANWVKADGSLIPRPTGQEPDSYFSSVATLKLDGTPLVYPIAAQFGDAAQLRREFRAQVEQLVSEMRCDWTSDALSSSGASSGNQQNYPFEMSNLFPYFRLSIDGQEADVQVFDGSSQPVELNASGVSRWRDENGLQLWWFARDSFAGAWSGNWLVRVMGSARIVVTRDIQPSELRWDPIETPEVAQGEPIRYQLRLMVGDTPVRKTAAFDLRLYVRDTSAGDQQAYTLEPDGDGFVTIIPGEQVKGVNYEFQPAIIFHEAWGRTIAAEQPYRIGTSSVVGIGKSPGMTVEAPGVNARWCIDGSQSFLVRLTGFDNFQGQADPASLYSYSKVELFYTPSAPLNPLTPTPGAPFVLNPVPEQNAFGITLDCQTQLLSGDQVMLIRGQLADQVPYEQIRVGAYVAPTATPTFTWTPTPTPTVTFTPPPPTQVSIVLPTPRPVSVVNGIIDPLTQPPLSTLLLAALAGVLLVGTVVAFRSYRRSYLPLAFITIQREAFPVPRPLLTGWRALLPFTQQKTIYEDGADVLFTVTRDEKGAFHHAPGAAYLLVELNAETMVVQPKNQTGGATFHYRIAPFLLFGSVLFTVQRLNERGEPYSRWEALNRLIPHANDYTVTSPEQRSMALFTIRWSRYEQALQIEAEQQLRVNNIEVPPGDSEVSYRQETSIITGAPAENIHIYNRRASNQG